MGTLYFDIETDGLYKDVSVAHCLVIIDDQNKVTKYSHPWGVHEGALRLLHAISEGDFICGHNVIDYDIPVLEKLYPDIRIPRSLRGQVVDTLVLARLQHGDIAESDYGRLKRGKIPGKLVGSQSLKAWGFRLGVLKGTYGEDHGDEAWTEFNEEMLEYCVQDVRVTKELHKYLTDHPYPSKAVGIEHEAAWLMAQQERNGFCFDIDKANLLLETLQKRAAVLEIDLRSKVPPIPDKDFIPKRDNKAKGYKAGVPVKRWKEFNPNSRQQIEWIITKHYGYTPAETDLYGENGALKIDETTFRYIKEDKDAPEELVSIATIFEEYLMVSKRLGQLATGSQAWLSHVWDDGRIHGSVNPCGAVTGRATHSSPNVAQVPAIGSPYGRECRELFKCPDGWWQAGADASGLELRCLAHFMYPYDHGAYAHEILNGDIHTANQRAAGLPERNQAKTFIYAFLYGAGDAKIGKIVHGDEKDGRRLKRKFLEHTPAIAQLKQAIQNVLVETYHGQVTKWKRKYLKGLDGRPLKVRSIHSALNLLLQSAGALVCKKWICLVEQHLVEDYGLDHGKDFQYMAWIHDEISVACRTHEIAELVVKVAQESMREAQRYYDFRVQLDTEGKIGKNWAEVH